MHGLAGFSISQIEEHKYINRSADAIVNQTITTLQYLGIA